MPQTDPSQQSSQRERRDRSLETIKNFELNEPGSRSGAVFKFFALTVVAAVLSALFVLPGALGASAATLAGITSFDNLPSDLKIQQFAQNSTMYALQNGTYIPIAQFYAQNRQDVGWNQISQNMKDAVVAVEDPRFYSEGAIDILGTIRGSLSTFLGGSVQGGSSITQQYVKNVEVEKCDAITNQTALQSCYNDAAGVTIQRKIQEMRYAIQLEKKYTKQQILNGYLNVVGFGGQVYGVQAAAEYYFNTSAQNLTLPEAATLAAILNNPNNLRIDEPQSTENGAANGYLLTKQRRNYVLDRMYDAGAITNAQRVAAKATPIQPTITPANTGCQQAAKYDAAFFCDYVRDVMERDTAYGATPDQRINTLNRGGLKIYTTLNLNLQEAAQNALSKYVPATKAGINLGASNVSVEPGTGHIITMVQNRAFNNTDQPIDGTTAINYNTDEAYGGSNGFQTGSTFKAFDLAAWLEAGHSLSDTISTTQHNFSFSDFTNSCVNIGSGQYSVSNDDPAPAQVSVMEATADSINTAFVNMSTRLDLCTIRNIAEAMGVHQAADPTAQLTSSPSMVLGTNTISPLTMATAYAGIANGGQVCTPIAIVRVVNPNGTDHKVSSTTCTQGMPSNIAQGLVYALQGVMRDGTAAGANPNDGVPIMGKTGTTDNSLQNWLITSTTNITQATWIGNVDGSTPLRSLSFDGINGGNVKLYVVRMIQQALDKAYGGNSFTTPQSSTIYGSQQTIPDVSGKSTADAVNLLQGLGFTVSIGTTPVPSNEPAGTVAGTNPAAGSSVQTGSAVTVEVSSGQASSTPSPSATPSVPSSTTTSAPPS